MRGEPDFFQNLQDELSDGRAWLDRTVVLGYAILAGLCVVLFTLMSETAFEWFMHLYAAAPWVVLIWTPALTAFIVWCTRSYFPGAAGSGIPQVMTALDPLLPRDSRHRFVSLRITFAKIVLGSLSLLGGLSAGREGPSVQVAAGVMHDARRWLRPGSVMSERALLVAGGAAGIAAAFNAPLAGVVFAIEELSKKLEARNNGLIIAAIVLAGLVSISAFGNLTYFGSIAVPRLGWGAILPGVLVTVICGVLGGLFSRLLAASLAGMPDRFSAFRKRFPVRFAAVCGLVVAIIGLASGGATFGAGAEEVRNMLAGESDISRMYVLLKFMATWITSWSGVPGGIFAPSLSIGAGVGHDVAQIVAGSKASALTPALIAMGMAAFLAATTQAPLTSFIIVMEMIDGRPMVLSLMAAAMLASLISRLISRPLYGTLSNLMLRPTREHQAREAAAETDAPVPAPSVHDSTAPADPPVGGPVQRSLLDDAGKDDLPPTSGAPPRKD
ncbi:MAG TPA: chloride channel protein [Hydrogenophaga sp.]|jgi:H+/Cl- antiporter ClcA|uniref:chloride channel protein n=1 Tax=Hydrogenophaga sp. TaxID=1904254 RepID=UPI000AB72FE5|nr:chloride channel protein [Hydrogenophaga sp.]MDZ4290813.1 chloride channel protein [Hydrogenophaga sp.]HAX22672.1 chloride channel protein [Hydrogenophaga sp.]HBU18213.1 chloride channel protein [Hydrogenophaga sp.]